MHSFKWSEYLCQCTVLMAQNQCTMNTVCSTHISMCITCLVYLFLCSNDKMLRDGIEVSNRNQCHIIMVVRNMRSIHLSLRQCIFIRCTHIFILTFNQLINMSWPMTVYPKHTHINRLREAAYWLLSTKSVSIWNWQATYLI